tara:strand:+ start:861 stop:1433 length:573 start_codon:yes stop_codon:yes gene_type:complete
MCFIVSLTIAQNVYATSMYIGIDYLNSKFDSGVENINSTLDEEDSGYSIFFGVPLNETLDIEYSYNDFGEASLSGTTGQQFKIDGTTYEWTANATLTSSATSHGFSAKPKVELSNGVFAYGKLGLHRWDSGFEVSSTNTSASLTETGTDVFYGGGVEVSLDQIQGRIGYSRYDIDGEDIDTVNFGLSLQF